MDKVKLAVSRCKGCGCCVSSCPMKAIARSGVKNARGYEVVTVNQELCIQCGTCYVVCPDYVFTVYGRGGD